MAFAPDTTLFQTGDSSVQGQFRHQGTNVMFEFSARNAQHDPAPSFAPDFTQLVWTTDGPRFARVLKTVAYVVVDEDEAGPVVERWEIKAHRDYTR